MELTIEEVNLRSWDRRDTYLYFTKMNPSAFSLTADIDITNSILYRKETGVSFFALCLWIVSKAVNEIPEFHFSYNEKKKLIKYNHILPMFPVFHKDSETCTMICVDTCQSFNDFLVEFNEQIDNSMRNRRFVTCKYSTPPVNVFNVSMEPRIHFNNCTLVHAFNPEKPVLYPIIVMGKYELQNEKYMMPVAIQINHAVSDGYQASQFYDKITAMFSEPEKYLGLN